MRLSVIIVTHNRRAALRRTLGALAANPSLPHDSMEVIVVDNGSHDDTAAECGRDDLNIHVIRRQRNEGVSARNYGFDRARGEYLLLIDDDSYPVDDAVDRAMRYLDSRPGTAAVVGRVELPDGTPEASALPGVVANGALCIRKSVIDLVGGLPREFFRQAEEYDLSFRIWNAGCRVARFEDLIFIHEKAPGNRRPQSVHRFDLRNNLILVERYLPRAFRGAYRRDWIRRYSALARHDGCARSALAARADGARWRLREHLKGRRPLSPDAFEHLFQHERQKRRVHEWAEANRVHRVAVADFGKNILATWRACRANGLEVVGVVDRHPAFRGLRYRGVPVCPSIPERVEGVVIANVNPAQIDRCEQRVREQFAGPVLRFWEPRACPVPSSGVTSIAARRSTGDNDPPFVLVQPSDGSRLRQRRPA